MAALIAFLFLGTAGVVLVVFSILASLPAKMIGDELRARIDDLPALFVWLALRLLPEDMREYYRPDWQGNLLAAFNDETAKYPVTRFLRSFAFGFSLLVGTRQIRKETETIRRTAVNDEQMERLPQAMIGGILLSYRRPDGTLVYIEPKAPNVFQTRAQNRLYRRLQLVSQLQRPEDWTWARWVMLRHLSDPD
jgi:hypothetical protein